MEKYNYLEAVTADAKNWLLENYSKDFIIEDDEDYDTYYNKMLNEDSVTGNASGSYTFDKWEAEENLCHNMDLLADAANDSGYINIPREWLEEPETADVIIRCHILNTAIENAINEIKIENEIQD